MTSGANAPRSTAAADGASMMGDAVRLAQAGDLRAFESVYRAHVTAVYALCRRMVGDDSEARDLVQDIFVRAWEKFASFRGESSLATWLHRLGVNVILEHLRTSRRDALRFADDPVDDVPAHGASAAERIDARLDLDAAIARLPSGARIVLVLHDLHGYSHDEIARLTGIAPGTSRAQLWRARRHLMRMLDR
ncbi:MAG TPA: RNA polymerase sigma factor [Gemmatimonadaceae bacterium]|jgi:RNA polymerase sigma-70 factor (ECF subfamily)